MPLNDMIYLVTDLTRYEIADQIVQSKDDDFRNLTIKGDRHTRRTKLILQGLLILVVRDVYYDFDLPDIEMIPDLVIDVDFQSIDRAKTMPVIIRSVMALADIENIDITWVHREKEIILLFRNEELRLRSGFKLWNQENLSNISFSFKWDNLPDY